MEIVCKNCNARYYIGDDKIPLETKTAKCKKCGASITVLGKNELNGELDLEEMTNIKYTQSIPPPKLASDLYVSLELDIYIFKEGRPVLAEIKRLIGKDSKVVFLEDQRLDQLTKVSLLFDSSTTTSKEINKANTGSMLGRAAAGAIVFGGAGAVVGGLSGSRESVINTSIIGTELTAELLFENGKNIYVLLIHKDLFYWLLGFANQPLLTDKELNFEKQKAEEYKKEQLLAIENEKIKNEKLELEEKSKIFIENESEKKLIKKIFIASIICITIIIYFFPWVIDIRPLPK
jgi:predicted Zn finger-like uncharacterized protein